MSTPLPPPAPPCGMPYGGIGGGQTGPGPPLCCASEAPPDIAGIAGIRGGTNPAFRISSLACESAASPVLSAAPLRCRCRSGDAVSPSRTTVPGVLRAWHSRMRMASSFIIPSGLSLRIHASRRAISDPYSDEGGAKSVARGDNIASVGCEKINSRARAADGVGGGCGGGAWRRCNQRARARRDRKRRAQWRAAVV